MNPQPSPGASGRGSRARWAAVLRTPLGAGAAVLLVAVLALAVLGPVLWSGQAKEFDTDRIMEGASGAHWLGTDGLGRDIFYRVLVATRLSVGLALLATAIGVAAGLVLGGAPSVLGRRAGRLVTAVVNIAVAFPALLLALFFAVVFGTGAKGAVLAIGFATAPAFARLTHTLVATVAERDYVAAARLAGVGRVRLLARHILPNVAGPLVVNATIGAGTALLAFSGLSFLGLGVQAPKYDWGRLLNEGLDAIYDHPGAALGPGVAVVVAGLAFNLFGETIAKAIGTDARAFGAVPLPRAVPADEPAADAPEAADGADGPVLDVADLRVAFPGPDGPNTPVRGVTFSVDRGQIVGMVGESGSGKSLTALAVAQLIEHPGRVSATRLNLLGTPLDGSSGRVRRKLLGTSLAMVFQDPATSFNPAKRIGGQLAEVSRQHQGLNRKRAHARAVDRLREARVPAAERRAAQYPHEFSGGMRQRAMIGMGMMGDPALIIADEPTTALDVTVQRQVLRLLDGIRREENVAVLFISHDIAVVTQLCDRVLVMYAGRIVEDLPAADLAAGARHPYTRGLLAAVPDLDTDLDRPMPVVAGRPVDAANAPAGCAFAPRCAFADDRCRAEEPPLVERDGWRGACWHPQRGPVDVAGPAPLTLEKSADRAQAGDER